MNIISLEGLVKIFAIICGLATNLIFNFIEYKELFSIKENKRNYIIIWILSLLILISVNLFSRMAEELNLLFYAAAGLSVPQFGLYLMIIKDLKKKEKIINDLRRIKAIKVPSLDDIIYFKTLKEDGTPCRDIEKKAKERSENYIKMGELERDKIDTYVAFIKYHTECA